MIETLSGFLEALFNEGEYLVLGKNKFDTRSTPFKGDIDLDNQFVSLNPMKEGKTRADANVAVYRNFLIEFDDLELGDQVPYIEEHGIPAASIVFSGNKSYHCVISLEDPVESKEEYDKLVRWIYAALPEADPSCKNCSRFTRLALGFNAKTKSLQHIQKLGNRISLADLKAWLVTKCKEPKDTATNINHQYMKDNPDFRGGLHPATKGFIKSGGRRGHRQKNIYIAACDLRDCNFTLEEAKFLLLDKIKKVYNKEGRDESELLIKERAIEDSYKKGVK